MNPLLTGLLNLPGVVVEDFQQTEKDLVLKVEQEDKHYQRRYFLQSRLLKFPSEKFGQA
jgi:hypothetical protein